MHRAITALSMRLCSKLARRAGGTPRMRAQSSKEGSKENSKAPKRFSDAGC